MKPFSTNKRIRNDRFTPACHQKTTSLNAGKLLFILLCCLLCSISVKAQDHAGAFITIWDTDKMSAGTHLEVPSTGTNYSYYWENVGDADINAGGNYITQSGNLSIPSIPNNAGKYRLYIKGNYTAIRMVENANSAPALTAVESWGNIVWSTMADAFRGCTNLVSIPIVAPNLSQVSSLANMFHSATAFNSPINNWNTSWVTRMNGMFSGAISFNSEINNWNTYKVTDMSSMFAGAISFNSPLNNWNTSIVTNMSGMFSGATAFNQPILKWNTSDVTNMSDMFSGATAFNQDLGGWQLSMGVNLTNFLNLSGIGCENYGLTLGKWLQNTRTPSNITLDAVGLRYASDALVFRNALENDKGWIISDAGEAPGCLSIDHTNAFITVWDTDKMDVNTRLEIPSSGNYDYYWEKVDNVGINSLVYQPKDLALTFDAVVAKTGKYRIYIKGAYTAIRMVNSSNSAKALTAVESWGNMEWASMDNAFRYCSNLASLPAAAPNLSQVTSMSYMFAGASIFNNPVDNWNTSNITDMSFMFSDAVAFNQPVGSWNTSKVTNMSAMFNSAIAFNQNLGGWPLKEGVNLVYLLNRSGLNCENYGLTLQGWAQNSNTPSNVTFDAAEIQYAHDALVYRDLLKNGKGWTISDAGESLNCSITNHTNAFITVWDTDKMDVGTHLEIPSSGSYGYYWEKVDNVAINSGSYQSKAGTLTLNSLVAKTGKYRIYIKGNYTAIRMLNNINSAKALTAVESWGNMAWISFEGAFTDCSNLVSLPAAAPNLSQVTTMAHMFRSATAFNQNLGSWQLKEGVDLSDFLNLSGISCENYSLTLKGWAENNNTPFSITLGAAGIRYASDALFYRNFLETDKGWTISDAGETLDCSLLDHANAFIAVWDTDKMDMGAYFRFPSTSNFDYYWEKVDNVAINSGKYFPSKGNSVDLHSLVPKTGKYRVYIKGDYTSIRMNQNSNSAKTLSAVESWGNMVWTSMEDAFRDCSNLTSLPATAPNLSQITSLANMFRDASIFNQPVNNWNTSNVTDMNFMFSGAIAFNQPIGSWNTSKVTNMTGMFQSATAFNQNLGGWQLKEGVSLVYFLNQAGLNCENYGLTLKGWGQNSSIPSNITLDASGTQYPSNALAFRNFLENDKGWTITDAGEAFGCSAIDHADAFITVWDTDKMDTGTHLEIPSSGNYGYYWEKTDNVAINSGNYQTKDGTLILTTLIAKTGTYRIYIKRGYTAINMSGNDNSAKALTAVESWGDMAWSSMEGAFRNCSNLASLPAAAPNLSQVTSMSYMFAGASIFNNPVDNWNTSNITDMSFMFSDAVAFNQPVGSWNTSKVTNMSAMFNSAIAFNQNLGGWQLKEGVSLIYFLNRSGTDCGNYGLTLKGWAQNPSTPGNLTLDAVTRQYASDALPYRDMLTGNGWSIDDGGVASGCNLPLPVSLIKYAVKLQASTVLISWQTVAELNNSHFILERSTDGIRFNFLKQIAAGFGGNTASNYSYTDAYPDNGTNYYRLSQVDLDGTEHRHGIRSVNVPLNKEPAILYPNPVSHLPVTVKFKPNLYNKASLFNVNGLLIDFKNITGSDEPVRFDTQQLLPGTYVIQLSGKETSVHQFVKQ